MLSSRLSQLRLVLNLLNSPPERLLLALDNKDLTEFGYSINDTDIYHVMSHDLLENYWLMILL